jgi:metal-responsive CopG/Arc/MetJ family transcriptional regulator
LSKALIRNQILGIRTTNDFIKKFDSLCDRLGHNRSEIIRYALKRFYNEHFNNPDGFSKIRKDLY